MRLPPRTAWRSALRATFLSAAVLGTLAPAVAWSLPAAAAGADADAAADPSSQPGAVTASFVRSEWHALFLGGQKIGYTTRSLYRLSDGGHRLKFNTFLIRRPGESQFSFYRMTTADVDARFRPKALECRVASGLRQWRVTGAARGGKFYMERSVDDNKTATAVPLEDDLTLQCWVLPATIMRGMRAGQTRRWLVIHESLGALLPDPCLVQVLGQRGMAADDDGENLVGTAVAEVCGLEQVIHLVDGQGRLLRSIWQTTPMVAESAGLSEARRMPAPGEPPAAAEVPGLTPRGFESEPLGLAFSVPPPPYAACVLDAAGAIRVTDLTDEASITFQAIQGRPALPEPAPTPPADPDADESEPAPLEAEHPEDDLLLASMPIHQQWASRFEDVTVEPSRATVPGGAEGAQVRAIAGTARLGCTVFHYRNLLYWGRGLTWFVSLMVADRPLRTEPVLSETILRSMRLNPPRGRLPLQAMGLTLRSPLYGFQVQRPSEAWVVPEHAGGPAMALELARKDQAAAALVRMLDPREGQTPEAFVLQQAQAAAETLGVETPVPRPARLGGLPGWEIAYEGDAILSGRRARCTTVYVPWQGRVLALVLVVASDADDGAAKEAERVRQGFQFLK